MSGLVELQKVGADKKILYIENDQKLQKSFGVYLQKTFNEFYSATNTDDGYVKFEQHKPHVVIMELDLDGKDPIEFIDDIQEIRSDVVIVTVSKQSDNYELLQTLDMGLAKMLLKPVNFPDIATVLIELLPQAVVVKAPVKKEQVSPQKKVVTQKPPSKPQKTIVKKQEPVVNEKKQLPKQEEKAQIKKEQKPKVAEPKKVQKEEKKEPLEVVKTKTPVELCFEFIQKLKESKILVEFFNSYKGVVVQNYGDVVSCYKEYFEVKVGLSQIIAAKYDGFVILRTEDNKYVHAKLKQINLKDGSLKLIEPRFLDYKHRDKNFNRFKADKSCKASIYVQKKLVEFSVDYLSFRSAELLVQNKEVQFTKGDVFDLTLGFDLSGPNKMIKEKKFVKVFARCEVLRIDEKEQFNKIIVLLQVKKSGETTLLRYLSQREEEIMFEFKSIIHR